MKRLFGVLSGAVCLAFSAGAWAQTAAKPDTDRTVEELKRDVAELKRASAITALQSDVAELKKAAALQPASPASSALPGAPALSRPQLTPEDQQKAIDALLKNAAAAKDKGDDAKPESLGDQFKEGKLVRYGITAGLAVAVHAPGGQELQRQWGVSAMPYLAVLPFWWGVRGRITKAYCAAGWIHSDDAQKVADTEAVAWAVQRVKARGKLFDVADSSDADSTALKRVPSVTQQEVDRVKALAEPQRTEALKKQESDRLKTFLDDPATYTGNVFDATGWRTDERGKCGPWAHLPGIYVGIPAKFTVNARAIEGDPYQARELSPIISVGLVAAPISAISLMVGATFSNAVSDTEKVDKDTAMKVQITEGTPGTNHVIGSLTMAIGGNLDIIGSLFGGK